MKKLTDGACRTMKRHEKGRSSPTAARNGYLLLVVLAVTIRTLEHNRLPGR